VLDEISKNGMLDFSILDPYHCRSHRTIAKQSMRCTLYSSPIVESYLQINKVPARVEKRIKLLRSAKELKSIELDSSGAAKDSAFSTTLLEPSDSLTELMLAQKKGIE